MVSKRMWGMHAVPFILHKSQCKQYYLQRCQALFRKSDHFPPKHCRPPGSLHANRKDTESPRYPSLPSCHAKCPGPSSFQEIAKLWRILRVYKNTWHGTQFMSIYVSKHRQGVIQCGQQYPQANHWNKYQGRHPVQYRSSVRSGNLMHANYASL